jgi:hypothetical protein
MMLPLSHENVYEIGFHCTVRVYAVMRGAATRMR